MYSFRKTSSQAGFTLIELMVSLSLFVIVVLAVIGSLYSVNRASQKAASMRTVLDNLNFAMDAMSRSIKTGHHLWCQPPENGVYSITDNHNCPMGSGQAHDSLQLVNTLGQKEIVQFRLDTDRKEIQKRTRVSETQPWGDWIAMTTPQISVETLSFYVDGANIAQGNNDFLQPSVIIVVKGSVTANDGEIIPFSLQTVASQRAAE